MYDALGQLANIDYSDTTPDVAFAYDRLGRMTLAVTSVSSNLYEFSRLDLAAETQNGMHILNYMRQMMRKNLIHG